MRKSLLSIAILSALSVPALSYADEAATPTAAAPAEEAKPDYTLAYNVGLYSQYIFRGLTQTAHRPAIQGGVDYAHSSGLYAGTWASNINWLEDSGAWHEGSIEWDIYGGFKNTIGDTGIGYDVGLLNYVYPGQKTSVGKASPGFVDPYTLEFYAALTYSWLQAKVSYGVTDIFGVKNSDGSYYAELNANYPIGDTGLTINAHVGRQEYDGKVRSAGIDNDKLYSYTDWKLGLTKSWANGINVGGYYTDTNASDAGYGNNFYGVNNIGDKAVTVFVQKVF